MLIIATCLTYACMWHLMNMKSHESTFPIWRLLFQKRVSRTGTSNYIPHRPWDVIFCPCPWYLLLAQHSQYLTTMWIHVPMLEKFICMKTGFCCVFTKMEMPFWHFCHLRNFHDWQQPTKIRILCCSGAEFHATGCGIGERAWVSVRKIVTKT